MVWRYNIEVGLKNYKLYCITPVPTLQYKGDGYWNEWEGLRVFARGFLGRVLEVFSRRRRICQESDPLLFGPDPKVLETSGRIWQVRDFIFFADCCPAPTTARPKAAIGS